MGSPGAKDLLAHVPAPNREFVEIEGADFCLWFAATHRE
jgi:hypothetical protein